MKTMFGKEVCETLHEVLIPDHCAVIAIDLQNDTMRPNGRAARAGKDVSALVDLLPRCAAFIGEARLLGVPVVHVQNVTLADGRSMSAAWLRCQDHILGDPELFLAGTWGAEICEEVAPAVPEIVITKHRPSAFVGTDLDMVLRANDVRTVVVIGEQTPGCVDATVRDAAHHDYYTVVVEDCVAAFEVELHKATLMIQRTRHDVVTAETVLEAWRRAGDVSGKASLREGARTLSA